tara:strand:+ start:443 stop:1894 length:1452 start_codon:yes stop_codon:yes gene_type:complete
MIFDSLAFDNKLSKIKKIFYDKEFLYFSPWLNPNKYHPNNIFHSYSEFIIKDKKNKFRTEKNLINKAKFFFKINKLCYSIKDFKKKDYLFVSHFINPAHLNVDYYFKNIFFKDIEHNSLILLRNHTSIKETKIKKLFQDSKVPRIIMPRGVFFKTAIIFLMKLIISYFHVLINILQLQDNSQKQILRKFIKIGNISQSIINYHYYYTLQKIIKMHNPKKIFFTYEGHTWERFIIKAAKDSKNDITCIAYQFSVILKNQNMLSAKFGYKYDPDLICVPGKFGSNYFIERSLRTINIGHFIGSKNDFNFKKKKINKNCLVMPEGIISECKIMFEFILEVRKKFQDINFIIRFHDQFDFKYFKKKYKEYDNIDEIIISQNNIQDDLKKCSFCLYRGTTGIFQAINNGLVPIYYDFMSDLNIDPFYLTTNKIKYVKTSNDLGNFIYSHANHKFFLDQFKSNKRLSNEYFNEFNHQNIDTIKYNDLYK